MEEAPRIETVEVDEIRFISLEFSRRWPQYVVEWSVRERHPEGTRDSDFPLAGGELERSPRSAASPDAIWEDLRQSALAEARQAMANVAGAEQPAKQHRSLLDRLLGRD